MKPSQTYFLRELQKSPGAAVLDFACSKGGLWDHVPEQVEMFGCDIRLAPEMATRIRGREHRFRLSTESSRIPFEDASFDVVFANSAFEHVQPIREIITECARVLRPGGRLIAVFPCRTVILEPHVKVPFASWLPPGALRRAWCQAWRGDGARADAYLREHTNYLRYGEYMRMLRQHFALTDITGQLVAIAGGLPLPGPLVSRFYAVAVDARKLSGPTNGADEGSRAGISPSS